MIQQSPIRKFQRVLAEITRLTAEVEDRNDRLFKKSLEVKRLTAEVERLRAALEWYASDANWLNPDRARAALQEPRND